MKKEELNLDYKKALEVFKDIMREGNYLLTVKIALEKQIPKKPIARFINAFSDDMASSCPCCKQPIVNVWNKRDYKPLYCHYCGQALDWSDTK